MCEIRSDEGRIQFREKRGRQPYNINTRNTLLEEIINVLEGWNPLLSYGGKGQPTYPSVELKQ